MKYGEYKTLEQFLSTTLKEKMLVKTKKASDIYDLIKSVKIQECKDNKLFFIIKTKEKGEYEAEMPLTGSVYEDEDSFVVMPYLLFLFPTELTDETETYGDKIEIEEFAHMVKCGGFIDSDGYGEVITKHNGIEGIHYNYDLTVNELASLAYHPDVTHIMWYNK